MKIEKVSDNQIRCFITGEEMKSRSLQLKELAYGTEKARDLFHELMQKAWQQYGFETENMPVMVEAVPMHDDSLVLIITRVENPEELDTRFSSFAPSVRSGGADHENQIPSALGQLLDTIRQEGGGRTPSEGRTSKGKPGPRRSSSPAGREDRPARESGSAGFLYTFSSLGLASRAAAAAADFEGTSSLYRDPADGRYYLFLEPGPDAKKAAGGNWLSAFPEFGKAEYITPAREQHLQEHCEVLCAKNAVERLVELNKKE